MEHMNTNDNISNPPPNNWNRIKYISIRSAVILVGLSGVILNSVFGYALPNTNVECIVDYSMNTTSSLNNYFAENEISKKLLLIFSSLCVDLIMIILGLLWVIHGKSWRVFISLMTFYILKIFFQLVFQEKTPDGYLWEYPGFPSIMVSYLNSNAFFYSTPTGFLTLATLEFWKTERMYLSAISFAILLLDISIRNILRANYIIDLFSAIIIAHFLFIISDDFCENYFDNLKNDWLNLKSNNPNMENKENNQNNGLEFENKKSPEIDIAIPTIGYTSVENKDLDKYKFN
jgi:hypothetical protein